MSSFLRADMAIRSWLLFIAVIPALLIAIVVGGYLTHSHLSDIESELNSRGELLASQLAAASEFGLFSGNRIMLTALANDVLAEKDVERITILNTEGELIIELPLEMTANEESDALLAGTWLRFTEPVTSMSVAVDDFNESITEQQPLGYVNVTMSNASLLERQWGILWRSGVIVLLGLLLSIFIAWRIGQNVSRPIEQLTRTVWSLRQGDYNARSQARAQTFELKMLEDGLNDMAENLQEAHAGLQQRIVVATDNLRRTVAELEKKNIALQNAQQQVMQASQAKMDFLAKMSHEIRTPVNAVVGFSRLLQKSIVNTDQQEYIRTIDKAATQLLNIIDDILNFSKLELGTIEIETIVFNLRDCLEDVIAMCSPQAHEKGLELVLLVHSDVPVQLYGDPTRISQIVSNLVNNAIKFTHRGSVAVQVTLERDYGNKAEVSISVRDTGIGIEPEHVGQLFEAFSQADTSITRRFGGTGLGLSIAKRLVKMMGGQIGVETEPGEGSTFWFKVTWPLEQEGKEDVRDSQLFDRRALLCEAHPLTRRAIRNQLLQAGMHVFNTAELDKVIELLATEGRDLFDIVLLGISDREGLHAHLQQSISRIRDVYRGPVLVMINEDETRLPEERQYGDSVYFASKPLRRLTTYRKIKYAIGEKHESELPGTREEDVFDLAGLRVLVADDNAFNLTLVEELLRQRDVFVHAVESGEEAIAVLEYDRFDVVLMDIHMPGIGGMEATRRIRQLHGDMARIPVIALTADVFANETGEFKKAGISDCLLKPVSELRLFELVARWCGRLNDEMLQHMSKMPPTAVDMSQVPEHLKGKLVVELENRVTEVNAAFAAHDWPQLTSQVHQLKGVSGYFGLKQLAEEVEELERLIKAHSPEVENALDRLTSLIGETLDVLSEGN